MNERVLDKIKELNKYLREIAQVRPSTFEEYLKDFKTKAACERYAERIIQAFIDLAFFVIKERGLPAPEEEKEAFDILLEAGFIEEELCRRLKEAKGMRNILAHQYGSVDDKVVFLAVAGELELDAKELIRSIKKIV